MQLPDGLIFFVFFCIFLFVFYSRVCRLFARSSGWSGVCVGVWVCGAMGMWGWGCVLTVHTRECIEYVSVGGGQGGGVGGGGWSGMRVSRM